MSRPFSRGRSSRHRGGSRGAGGQSKARSSRSVIAQETLRILEAGSYQSPLGEQVDLREQVAKCVHSTLLYNPSDQLLIPDSDETKVAGQTLVEITNESSLQAAHRLVQQYSADAVAVLNFASARNPGGGFLSGAQAQEESLARSSALYLCQTTPTCTAFYHANRKTESCLYTHHIIYSPGVPVFRDDSGALLERFYACAFITSPAVNAGVVRQRSRDNAEEEIASTMRGRMHRVLSIARLHKHSALVLGAFGCGVFKNSPEDVAGWWKELLAGPFAGVFQHVVMAIYASSDRDPNLRAFCDALPQAKIHWADRS
jgi:uncharacterized protein (TIGR02452 family)